MKSMSECTPLPTFSVRAKEALLQRAYAWVEQYMSRPPFDASHDFNHVLRVVSLAKLILRVEQTVHPDVQYDPLVVELAALMHDVNDHKYTAPAQLASPHEPLPTPTVEAQLLSLSCPPPLTHNISTITSHTSYSFSLAHLAQVASVLVLHPELAIIQDADRLDAMGAIGIGRAFAYGGAKGRGLEDTIVHFGEKLDRFGGGNEDGRREGVGGGEGGEVEGFQGLVGAGDGGWLEGWRERREQGGKVRDVIDISGTAGPENFRATFLHCEHDWVHVTECEA